MMNMAQFIFLALMILAMVVVILRYRQRRIGAIGFLLWLLLWAAASVTVLFPGGTIAMAHFLGIGRGADLVMYLGLILIFYLLFRVYVRLEKIDREMTQLVRATALREADLISPAGDPENPSYPSDPKA